MNSQPTIDKLVNASWDALTKNFLPLLGVAVISEVPEAMARVVGLVRGPGAGGETIVSAFGFVWSTWIALALFRACRIAFSGGRVKIYEALSFPWATVWLMIKTDICYFVIAMVFVMAGGGWVALFHLGGIARLIAGVVGAFLVMGVLFVVLRLLFIPGVVAFEQSGGAMRAFGRSWELSRQVSMPLLIVVTVVSIAVLLLTAPLDLLGKWVASEGVGAMAIYLAKVAVHSCAFVWAVLLPTQLYQQIVKAET